MPWPEAIELIPTEMHTGTYTCPQGDRDYLVYAPTARAARRAPLVLMLHGCLQSAEEFARGTRMHAHAASDGYVVVYAMQPSSRNMGAWNWFRAGDQQRDRGEPAILAGLVAEMIERFDCDPTRVYAAGLSAGAAMAVTLGRVYPDVFRGVGVHSGLPHACAHDAFSAMVAMQRGGDEPAGADEGEEHAERVPTIVFHGDRDRTVNVCNAMQVVDDATGRRLAEGAPDRIAGPLDTSTRGAVQGGYEYTTARIRGASGKLRVERWIVHGGGHAWYGGSPDGSYTDARGPDATGEMLRFFGGLKQDPRRSSSRRR